VDLVYTDLGVLGVADGAFRVIQLAPGVDFQEIVMTTHAPVVDWRKDKIAGEDKVG
jgi:3-oxoacid CoA-transferase subunit B